MLRLLALCSRSSSIVARSLPFTQYRHTSVLLRVNRARTNALRLLPRRYSSTEVNNSHSHCQSHSHSPSHSFFIGDQEKGEWLGKTYETHNDVMMFDTGISGSFASAAAQEFALAAHRGDVNYLLENLANVDLNARDIYGYSFLHYAVGHGHADVMKFLIAAGVSVHSTTHQGLTPIFLAVSYEDVISAQILLDNGAQLDVRDRSGHSPYHYTVYKKNPSQIGLRFMIEKGVDVNPKSNRGYYPIDEVVSAACAKFLLAHGAKLDNYFERPIVWHWIASSKSGELLRVMIDACIALKKSEDPSFKITNVLEYYNNEKHHTPLGTAIINNNLDCVKVLVEYGVDIDKIQGEEHEACNPLTLAVRHKFRECVLFLLSKDATVSAQALGEVNAMALFDVLLPHYKKISADDPESVDLLAPLSVACVNGNFLVLRKLIQMGANVHSDKASEAFQYACLNKQLHIVQYLYKKFQLDSQKVAPAVAHLIAQDEIKAIEELAHMGMDLTAMRPSPDEPSHTLLKAAATFGRNEIIRLLLRFGADVNDASAPLASAVHEDHHETVKLLLEQGADVNQVQGDFSTPLCHAKDMKMFNLLVDAGADAHYKYLIHMFSGFNRLELLKLILEKYDAKKYLEEVNPFSECTPLLIAALCGHVEVFKLLLEYGASIEARNPADEGRVIHLASALADFGSDEAGSLEIMKLCFAMGMSANEVAGPTYKFTPLTYAAAHAFPTGISLLLENGAEIDHQDSEGDTALHNAADKLHLECAKVLLKAGARRDIKNNKGQTPLDVAREKENSKDMVELLENAQARSLENRSEDKSQIIVECNQKETKT